MTPEGTVVVRGSIPNSDRLLLPGVNVRVRIAFGPSRSVLGVPEGAIQTIQGKNIVLIVNDRNLVEARQVTTGPLLNDRNVPESGGLTREQLARDKRVIEKGLSEDDRVVITPSKGVRPGDVVEVREKTGPER
jgi:multidrug efflux pump subunit AcrA (membrane-fusion protein)